MANEKTIELFHKLKEPKWTDFRDLFKKSKEFFINLRDEDSQQIASKAEIFNILSVLSVVIKIPKIENFSVYDEMVALLLEQQADEKLEGKIDEGEELEKTEISSKSTEAQEYCIDDS